MTELIIDLHISAEEYQKMYAGVAQNIFCYARDGRKVRFPAKHLQTFVQHSGIQGSFALTVTSDMKLQQIRRL